MVILVKYKYKYIYFSSYQRLEAKKALIGTTLIAYLPQKECIRKKLNKGG